MAEALSGISGWERSLMAAEKVKERLHRATSALDNAGIAYAVVGDNAVAEWVGRVDEDAVRNTKDVDILLRRGDLPAAKAALEAAGFLYHRSFSVDLFIDGPEGKASSGIHLLFAGEKVREADDQRLPDVADSERGVQFQVTSLEALVRMKLMAYRRKDQVHLIDLIKVGLIDETWPARFSPPLAARLQQLLDDPDG